jgi:hypothetical protein
MNPKTEVDRSAGVLARRTSVFGMNRTRRCLTALWAVLAGGLALAPSAFAAPWPLGTLTTNALTDSSCPPGYTCRGFTVTCPGVSNAINGFVALGPPQGAPRGLIMVFIGGGGTGWWSRQLPEMNALGEELRALGYLIVQVRWATDYLESSAGNDAGPAHLGCRSATIIKYVHDTWYLPLGVVKEGIGLPGFAVTGNSGGASQIGFALAFYGLDEILDVVVPTGGPPHSALAKSCLTNANERGYWFDLQTRQYIDRGFGFFTGDGPAARNDPAFLPRWLEESHSTGGTDYNHPRTRVHFIIGEQDGQMQTIARDYYNRLRAGNSPFVTWEIAPGTPHLVASTEAGRAAIKNALLGVRLLGPAFVNGQFQFTASGASNFNYVVECSTNLVGWTSVRTNRGPFTFVETNATAPQRFYRATYRP